MSRPLFGGQVKFASRLELIDEKGNLVELTRDGKKIGSKFFELNECRIEAIKRTHRGGLEYVTAAPGKGEAQRLKPVAELFAVQKPGAYTLRAEFQMYKSAGKTFELVKLGPVQIRLVHRRKE